LCDVRRLFYRMMVHFIIINGGSITIIVIWTSGCKRGRNESEGEFKWWVDISFLSSIT
jgi:hypothetical protein